MSALRIWLAAALVCGGTVLVGAQGFGDVFGEATNNEATLPIDISGEAGVRFQYFTDEEWDSEVDALPSAKLRFDASTSTAEAVISLDVDSTDTVATDLIDELYVTSYFGAGHLSAGLMRIEWGKGDGIHAIDPLNASDQSAGPKADYLDTRIPEAMVDMNLYLGSSGIAEIVYKPFFLPTQTALSGRWTIVDPTTIPGLSDIEQVNTHSLKYSQAAARLTGSLGPADLGALYYYGFMPEPGYAFSTTFTGTDPYDPTHYTVSAEIVYTRAQLIGAEASAALGPFTVRGEAGYWLSEDTDGTDPSLYNSRITYLGGFDVVVPGTNMLVSAQVLGSYTFATEGLTSEDVDRLRLFDGSSTSNIVVGAVEIPFAHDKMSFRLGGSYAIEAQGYILLPRYTWTVADGVELSLSGTVIDGEALDSGNSPYYAWRNNDSVEVGLRYQF